MWDLLTGVSLGSVLWSLAGLVFVGWLGRKWVGWVHNKFILPVRLVEDAQQRDPSPGWSLLPPGTQATLDQRFDYLRKCASVGRCASSCGGVAMMGMPTIVPVHSVTDWFVRWLGHKPQDRYRVAINGAGDSALLCVRCATIACSLCELKLANQNAAYAQFCAEQSQGIVDFQTVTLLDTLVTGVSASAKQITQKPSMMQARLSAVPALPANVANEQ